MILQVFDASDFIAFKGHFFYNLFSLSVLQNAKAQTRKPLAHSSLLRFSLEWIRDIFSKRRSIDTSIIWAAPSEKVYSSMRKMQRFSFIPNMHNVSSGHSLSIDTFYNVQWFYLWTAKALIKLRGWVWAWPSLSAHAPRHIFTWLILYVQRNVYATVLCTGL